MDDFENFLSLTFPETLQNVNLLPVAPTGGGGGASAGANTAGDAASAWSQLLGLGGGGAAAASANGAPTYDGGYMFTGGSPVGPDQQLYQPPSRDDWASLLSGGIDSNLASLNSNFPPVTTTLGDPATDVFTLPQPPAAAAAASSSVFPGLVSGANGSSSGFPEFDDDVVPPSAAFRNNPATLTLAMQESKPFGDALQLNGSRQYGGYPQSAGDISSTSSLATSLSAYGSDVGIPAGGAGRVKGERGGAGGSSRAALASASAAAAAVPGAYNARTMAAGFGGGAGVEEADDSSPGEPAISSGVAQPGFPKGRQFPNQQKRKRIRKRKLASMLSPEELVRTREANRVAAQRHREVAKQRRVQEAKQFDYVAQRNVELKEQVARLRKEIEGLTHLIRQMFAPQAQALRQQNAAAAAAGPAVNRAGLGPAAAAAPAPGVGRAAPFGMLDLQPLGGNRPPPQANEDLQFWGLVS